MAIVCCEPKGIYTSFLVTNIYVYGWIPQNGVHNFLVAFDSRQLNGIIAIIDVYLYEKLKVNLITPANINELVNILIVN